MYLSVYWDKLSYSTAHCGDGSRACSGASSCCALDKSNLLGFAFTHISARDFSAQVNPSATTPLSLACTAIDHATSVRPAAPQQQLVEFCSYPPPSSTPLHAIGIHELLDASTSFSTLASLLKHCGTQKSLPSGRFVHAHIRRHQLEQDRFLGNCLIEMYGECGSTTDARAVFDNLPSYNSYSWNIMINVYVKNGIGKDALDLFYQMLRKGFDPDYCTFICTLNACTYAGKLQDVQDVHAVIIEYGCMGEAGVETALIAVYGKCGCFWGAMSVFCRMLDPNVVSWNALLGVCVQNGHNQEALDVFRQMQQRGQEPDKITLTSTLDACAEVAAVVKGQQLHALVVKNGFHGDVALMTALVNMYGRCGSFSDAVASFSQIHQRDVVCWNAFLGACVDNDEWVLAVKSLHEMQAEGLKPDGLTFAYALDACTNLALLEEGRMIHNMIVMNGYERDLVLGTALVNMYGKCGAFSDAKDVFDEMPRHDVVSWSAIITACAQNGRSEEAFDCLHRMKGLGIKPDQTAYLSILTACSHAGWVYDGMSYFLLISQEHGMRPTIEHYMCMVDLLGRAGYLADAEQLILTMQYEQNAAIWSCLLGACRLHGDNRQGIRAANHAISMDSMNATSYVMLSDVVYSGGEFIFEEFKV